MEKQQIKFFANCMCGKKELTEKELKEGQENGCVMCGRCFMPKTIEKVEVRSK